MSNIPVDPPQAAIHPIDRDRLYAVIAIMGLIAGCLLAAAVYQLVGDIDPAANRVGRFAVLGVLAGLASLPVWYHLHLFPKSIERTADGLILRHGRRAEVVRWDDVAVLHHHEQLSFVYGQPVGRAGGFPAQPDLKIKLVLTSGRALRIDNYYRDIAALHAHTVGGALASLRRRADEALRRGEPVRFGPVAVSSESLTVVGGRRRWWNLGPAAWKEYATGVKLQGEGTLRFADVRSVRLEAAVQGPSSFFQLVVRRRGKKTPWAVLPLPHLPNFDLFAELLARFGHPIHDGAGTDDPDRPPSSAA